MLTLKLSNAQLQPVQIITLTPETATQQTSLIGRAATCDVVLDSVDVSRIHGKIQLQNGQYYYSDLASANGSYLNHKKLPLNQDCLLKSGDLISIGDFQLLIEAIDLTPAAPKSNQDKRSSEKLQSQPSGEFTVRCVRITHETADVKTLTFVAESALLFDFQPGQFVTLELEINSETVLRSYSISSSPTRPHTLEITVKRVPAPIDAPNAPPGLVSNWLHDHLKVGDRVKLTGIQGKFTCLPNPAAKVLMISAGSGITPMMSMSRWIADTARETDIIFFHSARTPDDIIFRRELELMATRLTNFHLAIAVTQPPLGQAWYGYTGRLNETMLYLIAPDFCDRTIYVCGPQGFMSSVKTLLERLSFPMQHYFEESFGVPKKAKQAKLETLPERVAIPADLPLAATQSIVRFAHSGTEIAADGTESILELAEQVNIKIRSNCRQGVCGACKKRKLEGTVRYESNPDALDADEQANGLILTCVALPVDRVVVEA